MCIASLIVVGICLYLIATLWASYVLSDGFRLDFSNLMLVTLALLWPVLGFLVLLSCYDEWQLKRKKAREGWK